MGGDEEPKQALRDSKSQSDLKTGAIEASFANPSLLVAVVNFRTPQLTIACLESLASEIDAFGAGCRVAIVDNGSGDGSAAQIAAAIEAHGWAWATLKALDRNEGFAFANNRAWEDFRAARYLLLLNSDTLVHRGCIRYCWTQMESDRSIGAMSSLVLNGDGTVQNVARKFPTLINQMLCATGLPWRLPGLFGWADPEDPAWDRRATSRDVDWIGGAFMFIRGDLVRTIGLLDEEFFFYGEDMEFCHRIWRAGYRVRFDPAVSITHLGGSSSDPSRMDVRERNVHRWRGRYLYFRKCHGRVAAELVRAVDILRCWVRLFLLSARGSRDEVKRGALSSTSRLLLSRLDSWK